MEEKRKTEILKIVNDIFDSAPKEGDIVDVVKLANSLGFRVFRLKNDSEFYGFILWSSDLSDDSTKEIGVIAYKANLAEQDNRFIIAHELGHYLLHNDKEKKNSVFSYTYHRQNDTNSDEEEADFFAANLLLPRVLFVKEWTELEKLNKRNVAIKILATRFKVNEKCVEKRIIETNVSQN